MSLAVAIDPAEIGVRGLGIAGWSVLASVLRGQAGLDAAPDPRPALRLVPPRERRRLTATIALALGAAEEALAARGKPEAGLATVFACSGGDTEVMDRICRSLLDPRRPVSPGDFH